MQCSSLAEKEQHAEQGGMGVLSGASPRNCIGPHKIPRCEWRGAAPALLQHGTARAGRSSSSQHLEQKASIAHNLKQLSACHAHLSDEFKA